MLLKGCVLATSLFGAAYAQASSYASAAASQASGVVSSARPQTSLTGSPASSSVATARTGSTSQAQNVHGSATPATTFSDPLVPTGTPVPGNYTGKLRPQIHFSPPQGFMNDPNGMFVDAQGIWHLYYQCKLDPDLVRMNTSLAAA